LPKGAEGATVLDSRFRPLRTPPERLVFARRLLLLILPPNPSDQRIDHRAGRRELCVPRRGAAGAVAGTLPHRIADPVLASFPVSILAFLAFLAFLAILRFASGFVPVVPVRLLLIVERIGVDLLAKELIGHEDHPVGLREHQPRRFLRA